MGSSLSLKHASTSSMMDCHSLFILSNVDGVFTGMPGEEGTEIIDIIEEDSEDIDQYIFPEKSGGIVRKYKPGCP